MRREGENVCYPNGLISFRISHGISHFSKCVQSCTLCVLISHIWGSSFLFPLVSCSLSRMCSISDENRFDKRDNQTLSCTVSYAVSCTASLAFITRDTTHTEHEIAKRSENSKQLLVFFLSWQTRINEREEGNSWKRDSKANDKRQNGGSKTKSAVHEGCISREEKSTEEGTDLQADSFSEGKEKKLKEKLLKPLLKRPEAVLKLHIENGMPPRVLFLDLNSD